MTTIDINLDGLRELLVEGRDALMMAANHDVAAAERSRLEQVAGRLDGAASMLDAMRDSRAGRA